MAIAKSDSPLSVYQESRKPVAGLLTQPSDYQAFTAPLSNKGNPTSKINPNTNVFSVPNDTPVRVVDSSTGKVIFEGVGFDATQQAIAAAQSLTDSKGKKAAWQIQIAPGAGTTWSTVAQEKENKSVLGKIADVALPVVGGILGGPLGAAAGSAASSVAQGRSLENTLLRAAIAGGTSALVPGGKAPVSVGGDVASQAAGNAATQAASQAATQAAAQAGEEIIVNAILPSLGSQILGGAAGGLASSFIPSVFDSSQLSNVTPTQPQPTVDSSVSDIIVTAPTAVSPSIPSAVIPSITSGILDAIASPSVPQAAQTQQPTQSDEIIVTAQPQPELNLGGIIGAIAPSAIPSVTAPPVAQPVTEPSIVDGGDIVVTARPQPEPSLGGILGAIVPTVIPPAPAPVTSAVTDAGEIVVTARPQPEPNVGGVISAIVPTVTPPPAPPSPPAATGSEDIVVTAKETPTLLPSVGAALATGIGATAVPAALSGSGTTTAPSKTGVLGTGLNATQLATLASLGISGLSSLFGGGRGGGGTTPYVSPFGAIGGGFGGGMDYRINPNIVDYERYGFGPEASFFRPEYNRLVNTGASMGAAPIQSYTPLI